MSRNHEKLKAFQLADALVLRVYALTRGFPRAEIFGLTSQMRRAALSTPSNIVEGCARHSLGDYLRLLDYAYGSAQELTYQVSVAQRLGYLEPPPAEALAAECREVCIVLNALLTSLRRKAG